MYSKMVISACLRVFQVSRQISSAFMVLKKVEVVAGQSNTTSVDTNDATAPLVTLLRNALPGGDRDHVWAAQGLAARRT